MIRNINSNFDIIQVKRATNSRWSSLNPVLLSGELGYATDTSVLKIGNGSTTWNSLSAISSSDNVLRNEVNQLRTQINNLPTNNNSSLKVATSSGDCNTHKTPGIYQGSWSSNRPPSSNSYGALIVVQTTHNSQNYVRQIYLSETDGKIWTRYNTNAWQSLGLMSLSGSTLNITL